MLKKINLNLLAIVIIIFSISLLYYKTINIWHLGEEYNLLWDFHNIDKTALYNYFIKPVNNLHTASFTYRPIWYNYFTSIYSSYGLNPIPYHLTILILHCSISCLLFLCFLKIVSYKVAFFGALFFAVNPVSICTAAWWNSSCDLFFPLFLLIAFYIHIYNESYSFFKRLLVSFFFIIALMTKENAILLAPLCILFDYFLLNNGTKIISQIKRILFRNSHIITVFFIYLYFRIYIFASFQSYGGAPKITPNLIFVVLLRRIRISLFYDINFRSMQLTSWQTAIISFIVLLLILFFFFYFIKNIKKNINIKFLLFCFLMYIISSLPVINISNSIKSYPLIMNTRYIYFPMIFVLFAFVYLIINLLNVKTSNMILLFFSVFFIYKTYTRINIFIEATEFSRNRFNNMQSILKENANINLPEIKKLLFVPESSYKSLHWYQTDFCIENQFNLAKEHLKSEY